MSFLRCYFNLGAEYSGEQMVCCPYPHQHGDGTTYYDTNPSLAINLDKGVFKCHSCGQAGSEAQLCRDMWHVTESRARNICRALRQYSDTDWHSTPEDSDDTPVIQNYIDKLGISRDVLEQLGVQIHDTGTDEPRWIFPVVYNNYILDLRDYQHGRTPKVLSCANAPTGAIIPHDVFVASDINRWVVLCAGEKDMLVTRSHGFNAITFTGGEMCQNIIKADDFKDRKIAICYDNDQAGRHGAGAIAKVLLRAGAKTVRIVDKFHHDFPKLDTKEDLTDWFTVYGGTSERLKQYIIDTPDVESDVVETESAKMCTIEEAIDPSLHGQLVTVRAQVTTTGDVPQTVPAIAKVKTYVKARDDFETYDWDVSEHYDILPRLINVPPNVLSSTIISDLQIPAKGATVVTEYWYTDPETNVKKKKVLPRINTYAVTIGQFEGAQRKELPCYSLNTCPEQGQTYDFTIFMTTTLQGAVCGVILDAKDCRAINNEISDEQLASLTRLQHVEGTAEEKLMHRLKAVQGLLAYEANLNLIATIDLTLNSVCEIQTCQGPKRGYLDTLVIGESRIGKSDTANKLLDAYGMGTFVSVAGSQSTEAGLIGGTDKDKHTGAMVTKAGTLPRNCDKAIIIEELSKAPDNLIRDLTDIRSSGKVRISRVTGDIVFPCKLRMCALSNAKPDFRTGITRPLDQYEHGIKVATDLIGTAEDIARYDVITLVGDSKTNRAWTAPEPIDAKDLQHALAWVWSRTPEQIKITDMASNMATVCGDKLNEEFPMHIKLFGTEAQFKLLRFAAAIAAYTISASDDFTEIIVTEEHVRCADKFLRSVYDNRLFKLRDYVDINKRMTVPDAPATDTAQKWMAKYGVAFAYLYTHRRVTRNELTAIMGVEVAEQGPFLREMYAHYLLHEVSGGSIDTTPKFIATYENLRDMEVPRC